MAHWTSGYVDGLTYTYDFYRKLTPAIMAFTALCRGQKFNLAAPHLTYCELGCGQGFSVNLLAAANPQIQFHAMDFNPAHIANARGLAAEAGLGNAHFHESAFADFAGEPGLPESFDIIALHGVMSWVSAENRRHIVDFISRKLKPGGLVYVSYNALPGWAGAMPLRRILVDRAARTSGPLAARIDDALGFAASLGQVEADYFKHQPAVGTRLKGMAGMSRNYLAHEYFNRDWTPFYFEDVAGELSEAKLSFVGPLSLIEHIDEISLTQEQQELLRAEPDPVRRETLRDFIVDETFRTDLFVKGALPHTERSAAGIWLDMRFALTVMPEEVSPTIKARLGEVALPAEVYGPLLRAFTDGPKSIRQILTSNAISGVSWGQITQALTVLVGADHLQPCLPEQDEAVRAERCKAFNLAVCKRAEDSETLQFLASPVTGGGLAMNRAEQLFMLAISEGRQEPWEWVEFAWRVLAPQGQRLVRDGKTLETDQENLAELSLRADNFSQVRLPVCRNLQIGL